MTVFFEIMFSRDANEFTATLLNEENSIPREEKNILNKNFEESAMETIYQDKPTFLPVDTNNENVSTYNSNTNRLILQQKQLQIMDKDVNVVNEKLINEQDCKNSKRKPVVVVSLSLFFFCYKFETHKKMKKCNIIMRLIIYKPRDLLTL